MAVSVRIDVALPLAVCELVGLALGARSSTSVASVSRRPVSRQLAIAPPPPYRPAALCAEMRLGENNDAPCPNQPPPSMPAVQFTMVTRCASMSADTANSPPPLALAVLPTMAVSMSVTTGWHEAVDARAKRRLPPLPPARAVLFDSHADCRSSVGAAAPLTKPLVPATDMPAAAADDDTVQMNDSAPPPVAMTASTGQLAAAAHDPALDDETDRSTSAAAKLSFGTMPATTDTAPPRTPAVQPVAFRPAICTEPPRPGWLGTLTAIQPPSPLAALDAHEMDVRMALTPLSCMAPPDAAAEQRTQDATLTVAVDVDAADA